MPDLRLRSVVVVCRRSDIWFGLPGDWHGLGLGPPRPVRPGGPVNPRTAPPSDRLALVSHRKKGFT